MSAERARGLAGVHLDVVVERNATRVAASASFTAVVFCGTGNTGYLFSEGSGVIYVGYTIDICGTENPRPDGFSCVDYIFFATGMSK